MRILLLVFVVVQLATGLLLWITPGFFYEEIGPFGPRNDHYMGDLATFYIALGAVGLISLRQVSWRVPVLAFAVIAYALHSLNHLIDVGEAEPSWVGPADLVLISLGTLLLAWMLKREREVAA
ncbi:MAG: hypothetical protein QOE69_2209 [Thermoleophilaceae bacterium]|jgi:hypothetical protein|nr:hypothetical protein [Thermoleophilaceae bacterium]MEA2408090.1 hypothetical protein [Thermoleophilaceae bacterium]